MMASSNRETVLVAMSGGVDSSVAAALLVEQGHDVVGVTMKTFCYSETPTGGRTCCGLDGIRDARRVADTLGIPHHVFDMEESFTREVIDDFVREYAGGRTPNPCVRCNSNTKIPHLLQRGRAFGADAIATGHYARVRTTREATEVLRGRDRAKDQSYFLWGIPSDVVPALRFPVGALSKTEVRTMARRLGLVTADKPESQEICFVPDGDYAGFLTARLGEAHPSLQPGAIVDAEGTIVGTHDGYARYTVGQRRGLGGGRRQPLFVLGVRPAANEVVAGTHQDLFADGVVLDDLNWIAEPPAPGEMVEVQLRHRAAPLRARVTTVTEGELVLALDRPARAVTPGQSGAVYRGEQLVGGGRIRGSVA